MPQYQHSPIPAISVRAWLPAGGIRMLSFISFTPGGKSFMYQGWSWISWMVMRLEGSEGRPPRTNKRGGQAGR